jgi:hypothetical protein
MARNEIFVEIQTKPLFSTCVPPRRRKQGWHVHFVNDHFEQIREQIHEIRNFLGPLDVKLEGLDYQIKRSRATFEMKTLELETKIAAHSSEIALHSEQIRLIQTFLKIPQNPDGRPSAPTREDIQNPERPSQNQE